MLRRSARCEAGFTLAETLVALAIVVTAVLGLVPSFVFATRANERARAMALATVLASEQIDRLRALSWHLDPAGARVSDIDTDLTVVPERVGGRGLTPSPSDALERNVAGHCDFLDRRGRWLSGGTSPPVGTAYVRRWLIEPLAANPADGLVVHVRVMPALGAVSDRRPAADEVRIVTVRARTTR